MRYLAEYLFEYIGFIILVAGCALLVADGQLLFKSYNQERASILEQTVVYAQEIETGDMNRVSREELAATLIADLPYDIAIDGIVFPVDSFHSRLFDYASLTAAYYTKDYVYDENGSIVQIDYRKGT